MKKIFLTIMTFAIGFSLMAEETIKVVTATGRGETREAALANAEKNAVASVTGTVMKSFESIKDDKVTSNIELFSSGFIGKEPKVISEYKDQSITIEAEVLYKKMKDWVAARVVEVEISADAPDQAQGLSRIEQQQQALKRMLIAHLEDFALIHQVTPVKKHLTSDNKGNTLLAVDFDVTTSGANYKNFINNLNYNLGKLGLTQSDRFIPQKALIEYPLTPRAKTYWIIPDYAKKITTELKAYFDLTQLYVNFKALDANGEVLAEEDGLLQPRPFNCNSGNRVILDLPYGFNKPWKAKGYVTFAFFDPDDATKVEKIRVTTYLKHFESSLQIIGSRSNISYGLQNKYYK